MRAGQRAIWHLETQKIAHLKASDGVNLAKTGVQRDSEARNGQRTGHLSANLTSPPHPHQAAIGVIRLR